MSSRKKGVLTATAGKTGMHAWTCCDGVSGCRLQGSRKSKQSVDVAVLPMAQFTAVGICCLVNCDSKCHDTIPDAMA